MIADFGSLARLETRKLNAAFLDCLVDGENSKQGEDAYSAVTGIPSPWLAATVVRGWVQELNAMSLN